MLKAVGLYKNIHSGQIRMMRKRHNPSPKKSLASCESGSLIPLHNQQQQSNTDDEKRKLVSWRSLEQAREKTTLISILLSILILISLKSIFGAIFPMSGDDLAAYIPLQPTNNNITNPFISEFENTLLNDLGHDNDHFVPLLFENGQILCRKKHKSQVSHYRARFFTQMVRKHLQQQQKNHTSHLDGLPVLVMETDGNGCNVHFHRDDYNFPRLAWSTIHPKHGACAAISMPSYETWKYYHYSHKQPKDWEYTFAKNNKQYPWSNKIDKAIWRGSTTYEGSQYSNSELKDTPRGKLVMQSMEHPHLIDAGFHKIVQKFKEQKKELKKEFNVVKRMDLTDMMKYKAIIDIDGNNWSSRFGMLLCSNSVVIKIEPDFIEHFYDTNGEVQPMKHYVPASLDNLTQVVSYVMDKSNDDEMQAIVTAANTWCRESLTEEGLARDALVQLDSYKKALDAYHNGTWKKEWKIVKQQFTDWVDCDAWSIIDWFTVPMFAGL